LAALGAAGREGRGLLAERIRQAQDLFAPLRRTSFYLSKLGVVAGSRRARHGRSLVREYLRAGASAGYRRFRLDVWAENRPAVELYRGFGFDVRRRSADHPPA
jgi:ribosomal protein S18 acetylase RimI-like enzyme